MKTQFTLLAMVTFLGSLLVAPASAFAGGYVQGAVQGGQVQLMAVPQTATQTVVVVKPAPHVVKKNVVVVKKVVKKPAKKVVIVKKPVKKMAAKKVIIVKKVVIMKKPMHKHAHNHMQTAHQNQVVILKSVIK